MKKLLKKKDGFTLVELIVVIAILAILAAVAIPAYSGYIKKAHDAADLTQLDSIKTAAAMAYTEDHINDATLAEITNITVNASSGTISTITVNGTNYTTKITELVGGTLPKFEGTYATKGAQWTSTSAKWDPIP